MKSDDTRKKINESAMRLIAIKGCDNTRTREIADLSGISEATLFRYYRSKEEIMVTVIGERARRFIDLSRSSVGAVIRDFKPSGTSPYRELLGRVAEERMCAFYKENELIKILLREKFFNEAISGIYLEAVTSALKSILQAIIDKGRAAGEIKAEVGMSDALSALIVYGAASGEPEEKLSSPLHALIGLDSRRPA
jgi:AcrR family transcriptional regulator